MEKIKTPRLFNYIIENSKRSPLLFDLLVRCIDTIFAFIWEIREIGTRTKNVDEKDLEELRKRWDAFLTQFVEIQQKYLELLNELKAE